jgi:hypothetical protein
MKFLQRHKWLSLSATLILLLLAAFWLADTWLESSGGREMLEQNLSSRIGVPVRLQGEFDLALWPSIGVSGTELVIGDPGPDSELIRSGEYAFAVALLPLLEKQLVIERVEVRGSTIYPDRFYGVLKSGAGGPIHLDSLMISDFTVNQETPFAFEIDELLSVAGSFRWNPSQFVIFFSDLNLVTAGGEAVGQGCLRLQTPISLQLDLEAESLDLDTIRDSLPQMGEMAGGGDGPSFDARIHLRAGELKAAGAVARGAVIRFGIPGDCPTGN